MLTWAPSMTRADAPRGVAILGSTGSIGTTALRVLERQRDRFRVAALTAFNNAELLGEQVAQFAPGFVGIVAEWRDAARRVARRRGVSRRGGAARRRRHRAQRDRRRGGTRRDAGRARRGASASRSRTRKRSSWRARSSTDGVRGGRRRDRSGRQRAQRDSAVHHRPAGRRGAARHHHRVGRTVPRVDRRAARARDARGRAAASDVAHGPEDHRRQRDARQQGARGDRGALSVRAAVRPDRGRRASAEHRALVRRVRRRERARAARRAEHGAARAVRADASGTRCRTRGVPRVRSGRALAADVRAVRRRAVSRRLRSASRRAGGVARRRRCSTRRTRRPWRFSSTDEFGSATSARRLRARWTRSAICAGDSRDAILAADARGASSRSGTVRMLADSRSNSRLRARDLRARARALHRREGARRLRAAVLDRLRPGDLPLPPRRDRVHPRRGCRSAATCAWRRATTPRPRSSRAATRKQTARTENDPDYDPNAMIPFGPKPVPENRWFESKPLWARIVIMIAGVVMNIVLAIVVATWLALHYGAVVVSGDGRSARCARPRRRRQLAQLQSGDTIRAVNGARACATGTTCGEASCAVRGLGRASTTQRGRCHAFRSATRRRRCTVADVAGPVPAAGDRHGLPGRSAPGRRSAATAIRSSSVGGAPVRSWSDMVDGVSASAGTAGRRSSCTAARRTDTLHVTPKAVDGNGSGDGALERRSGRSARARRTRRARVAR